MKQCISLRLCEKTKKILKNIPAGEKGPYIRRAIIFYAEFGEILNRIEQKVDAIKVEPGISTMQKKSENKKADNKKADKDYLFSGIDEIL